MHSHTHYPVFLRGRGRGTLLHAGYQDLIQIQNGEWHFSICLQKKSQLQEYKIKHYYNSITTIGILLPYYYNYSQNDPCTLSHLQTGDPWQSVVLL